jgi:ATP-dependent protease ClpP protease subunit
MKSWYLIQNKEGADNKPAEISIFDEIGYWGVTAKDFIAGFNAISAESVNLSINSPGGSVFDALAMFNAMKASGKTINVTVLGIAASAASYIAMVGDTISMPENTFMFVHNPINAVYGNAEDMREMAAVLEKIGASLTATYVKRTGKTQEEVEALLAAESYLTAAECVALGFADTMTDAITATAKFEVDRLPANVKALFAATVDPELLEEQGAPSTDVIVAAVEKAGLAEYSATFATDARITSLEMANQLIARAKDVRALCTLVKKPDEARRYITNHMSIAQVRAELAEVIASDDEKLHVDTTTKLKAEAEAASLPKLNVNDVYANRAAARTGKK